MKQLLRKAGGGVLALMGAVALAFFTGVGSDLWNVVKHSLWPARTLQEQISDITDTAAEKGLKLALKPIQVKFRPSDRPAEIMVFTPIDARSSESDELRIYEDVHDNERHSDKLDLKLRFRPRPGGPSAGRAGRIGMPIAGAPQSLTIKIRSVGDLDAIPGDDMIVDVYELAERPRWPRPLYVSWDPVKRRYKIQALLSPATIGSQTMRPYLTRRYAHGSPITSLFLDDIYTKPLTLVDATGTEPPLKAFAVEDYVLNRERERDPRGPRPGGIALTAGYVVRSASFGIPDLLQRLTWHLDLQAEPLRARASMRPPDIVTVGAQASRLRQLLQRFPS